MKNEDKTQTDQGSDAGTAGVNQSEDNKNTDNESAAASGAGDQNQGQEEGQNNGQDDGKTEAEKAEETRLAGLKSEIGAEEERLKNLRLEKRNLNSDGTNGTGDQGAGDAGNGEAETENEKKLKEQLKGHQDQIQSEAIKDFSNNTKFKFVNPSHDANNANWNKMMQENPVNVTAEDTKETIAAKLKRSYYATFGEKIEEEATEAGRANGQADAATAHAADTGGGSQTEKKTKIALTPEQRAAAKKLGQSEDDYIKGLELQAKQAELHQ